MQLPTPEQAAADLRRLGVSASQAMIESLFRYCQILAQWQARINLISPKTLPDIWARHILDSAQIGPHITANAKILTDIGSGAGFPALVLAVLYPDLQVVCVESDTRKCAFLMAAARELGLKIRVQNMRVEAYDWTGTDIITARALASLHDLTVYLQTAQAVNPTVAAILPKGAQWQAEVAEATDLSQLFHVKHVPSTSDPSAVLLVLSPIATCV